MSERAVELPLDPNVLPQMIRPATINDVDAITGIYNHYVENTIITFEEVLVSSIEMRSRILEVESS